MSLVINAPTVERKLRQEATKQGVSAADYAVRILETHLGASPDAGQDAAAENPPPISQRPVYETATPQEWARQFDAWVEGHPRRQPLPGTAFDRSGFYEGRP